MVASDFDDVLDSVMGNNLSLKYRYVENEAALDEMKAENTLPAPEFSYENLWGAKGIGDKRNFSIGQSFDWPGVYAARRKAIADSRTAMQYLREAEALDVRMSIRVTLIDIINFRKRIAASEKIVAALSDMVSYFKKAVAEGLETRLDYNKAVVEHINAVRELKTLRAEYAVVKASLVELNGGKDVEALIDKLGTTYPTANLESLRPDRNTILKKDPAMAASAASEEMQKSLVKVEKQSLLPGFSVAYLHEWEMGDNFNGVSISISLPFLTGRKKVKAAGARLETLSLQREMDLIALMQKMDGDYRAVLDLKEVLDEYRGVMSDDSNFELLKKAHDSGQISFLTYMQELNYFLTARQDFLDLHYRYHLALARLQRYE
ncbi:MAG: TolC family protein [Staphylococcus sp.]|nr:TolC family protein [Staphylococcus sp.]